MVCRDTPLPGHMTVCGMQVYVRLIKAGAAIAPRPCRGVACASRAGPVQQLNCHRQTGAAPAVAERSQDAPLPGCIRHREGHGGHLPGQPGRWTGLCRPPCLWHAWRGGICILPVTRLATALCLAAVPCASAFGAPPRAARHTP